MAQDPVVSLLLKAPLTPAQRRAASEAFTGSANEDDLQTRMETLQLPRAVMADLWDLKAAAPSPVTQTPNQPEGSALSRFASNAGEMLNPVSMVKGVANAVMHPIDTATGIIRQANDQRLKAHEAQDRGDYGEMAARSVAAAIPVLGPLAADIGEQIGSGDVAGGLGKITGLAVPAVAGKAVAMRGAQNLTKADALRRQAEQTVSHKVLAPANPKYRAAAQRVAPDILERGVKGDRIAIQQWADDLVGNAQQRMDDVIASYPATDRLPTSATLQTLDDAMGRMQFQGANGAAQVNPALQSAFDALQSQRKFVADLGADMSFADMRRLRQQLDDIAEQAGAFSKAKGDVSLSALENAALETSNAIRKQIAASRPELAVPHADMNLGLTVRDILDPAKGRPVTPRATTGATGGLHTTGALIGSAASNVPIVRSFAAFIASDLLPRIREAQVSPANQLRLAQDMHKLSEHLKAGKPSLVKNTMLKMSMYVPGLSGQMTRVTEPQAGTR